MIAVLALWWLLREPFRDHGDPAGLLAGASPRVALIAVLALWWSWSERFRDHPKA
jgi:nitrogen fixation-related uncharacterized protein